MQQGGIKLPYKLNINTHSILLLILMLSMRLANVSAAPPTNLLTNVQHNAQDMLVTMRNIKLSASNMDMPATASLTVNYNKRARKRHSKRHSNWFDENSNDLEWVNPCGGFYMPANLPLGETAWKKQMPNKIYNVLKKSANNELNTLRGSKQDIDINNIKIWKLHDYAYKFLPKLKLNSTIALKRWYRNMQTYVASFAYLRRVQLKWDLSKSQRESSVARELKRLLLSSRAMLCELETAVNGTRSHAHKKLDHVTRAQMEKRLKLRSKKRIDQNPNDLQEADPIDLKFVKYYYYEFLETMWKVLRRATKRKGKTTQRRNKQQQQQQKSFNEVDKLATRSRNNKRLNGSRNRNNERLNKTKQLKISAA